MQQDEYLINSRQNIRIISLPTTIKQYFNTALNYKTIEGALFTIKFR